MKVPSTLPFLTFQGAGASSTSISWNSVAGDIGPDGKALGSYNSASVMVFAPNFVARDIAFKVTRPLFLPESSCLISQSCNHLHVLLTELM